MKHLYNGVRFYVVTNYNDNGEAIVPERETESFFDALDMAKETPIAVVETVTDGWVEHCDYFTPKHTVSDKRFT